VGCSIVVGFYGQHPEKLVERASDRHRTETIVGELGIPDPAGVYVAQLEDEKIAERITSNRQETRLKLFGILINLLRDRLFAVSTAKEDRYRCLAVTLRQWRAHELVKPRTPEVQEKIAVINWKWPAQLALHLINLSCGCWSVMVAERL